MAHRPSQPQTSPVRARRLGFADTEATIRFVSGVAREAPLVNGWVHRHGTVPTPHGERFALFGCIEGEEVTALALVIGGGYAALVTRTDSAAAMLAAAMRQEAVSPNVVHGPPGAVRTFLAFRDSLGGAGAPRGAGLRVHQEILCLESRDLRYIPSPLLRPATLFDVEDVLEATTAMQEEELGVVIGPGQLDALRGGLAQQVVEERVWILRDPIDGRLLFKVTIAATAPAVALLEGVWTAPHARRRGIGRAATAELSRHLLTRHEAVVLHTRTDNAPARALYRELGYRSIGEALLAMLPRSLPQVL